MTDMQCLVSDNTLSPLPHKIKQTLKVICRIDVYKIFCQIIIIISLALLPNIINIDEKIAKF